MKEKRCGMVWNSEKEMQHKFKEKIKSWKPNDSKDGFTQWAEGKFVYRGIAYLIKVLRYYILKDGFVSMGNRVSDSHAVVEYTKETKPIVDLISWGFIDISEFLYHDTLHTWNENQTIEEQIIECHRLAKKDIDNLLDGGIRNEINEKTKELQKLNADLKRKISEIKNKGDNK